MIPCNVVEIYRYLCLITNVSLSTYMSTCHVNEQFLHIFGIERCIVLLLFLGVFAKLQKMTITFITSFRPSAWYISAPTRQIFMKFDIRVFFKNLLREFKFH